MSARVGARAIYRWDGTVAISFPFDRGLVEDLKYQIPDKGRETATMVKINAAFETLLKRGVA